MPLVLLTSVPNAFHARIIAARLGADGIVSQLRGNVESPYPVGGVEVLVRSDQLDEARALLLADEVEQAFAEPEPVEVAYRSGRPRGTSGLVVSVVALALLVALVVVGVLTVG